MASSSYRSPDHWTLKALKEGYPARSVYKLKEIDEKFKLIPVHGTKVGAILDVGAAPGSWSLYVLRKLAGKGFLTAVDLSPLSRSYDKGLFDGKNFSFIQGDVCDPTIRAQVLKKGPYELIISDVAPATSGNRSVDTLRSLALVEEVLAIAGEVLAPGGNLVVKVFQGGDTKSALDAIKATFKQARAFKPEACRNESFETYYLGLGKNP